MNRPKQLVWSNAEDEVLKVGVMKYGQNQWSRISSLLPRKTAKQCKTRWNEWVNPTINKSPWNRNEEQRLVHLAKVMPTQWRTISEILGRTALQCQEHYEKMLNDALNHNDIGKSRDEVDLLPETRPVQPDPVDMDEDQREMLSETRARLANTLTKKSKRRARIRDLEESRRLTQLQKRREFEEAGIRIKNQPSKGPDYNEDVPFQHKPPDGPFDTRDELEREKQSKSKGPTRFRSKQDKPLQIKRRDQIPTGRSMLKREKMRIPTPNLGEGELHDFVKMRVKNEEARWIMLKDTDLSVSFVGKDYAHTPSIRKRSESISTPVSKPSATQQSSEIQILEQGFRNLPLPKNEFEILIPPEEKRTDVSDDVDVESLIEDAKQTMKLKPKPDQSASDPNVKSLIQSMMERMNPKHKPHQLMFVNEGKNRLISTLSRWTQRAKAMELDVATDLDESMKQSLSISREIHDLYQSISNARLQICKPH